MHTLALTGLLCLHTGAPKGAPLKPRSVTSGTPQPRDRMCNCIPATHGRNSITSWSGQSPDTPEQGRHHPRILNAPEQRRAVFTLPGRLSHSLRPETPQKRTQAVLRRGGYIDADRGIYSGTDFKYIPDGTDIFKICFAALTVWRNI